MFEDLKATVVKKAEEEIAKGNESLWHNYNDTDAQGDVDMGEPEMMMIGEQKGGEKKEKDEFDREFDRIWTDMKKEL